MSARRNRVRIIGGEWRSRWLNFPDGQDLRPTPDRVRETLFNWLGQDLTGKTCLDLYAGSGALGFEAASRGARRVVLVERERVTVAALNESRAALKANQAEVLRADALEFLRLAARSAAAPGGRFDVVFLDPPFGQEWIARVEPLLEAHEAGHGAFGRADDEVPEHPALPRRVPPPHVLGPRPGPGAHRATLIGQRPAAQHRRRRARAR